MKQLTALVWKEWREVRVFLWIAFGVFIGLPIIAGLEAMVQYSHRFEISTSPWVLGFGGVLAVFVAVGATCRDFSGHLEDFWRSQPVGITRWLLAKYFVGLAVVLVACALPLAIEVSIDRDKSALPLIVWFPFLWAALYGIAFLAGCLVRRTSHAAMLALAAMLLVYCLPVVIPPLQWLNVSTVTDFSTGMLGPWPRVLGLSQLAFAAGMLGLAIAVLVLSLLAVHFDWRVGSGRKMMYASLSAAILILFASAAFQLGTNMPILRQIDMPMGEQVCRIHCDGNDGYVITRTGRLIAPTPDSTVRKYECNFRTVKLTDSGIELGNPIRVASQFTYDLWFHVHAPGHPETIYYISNTGEEERETLWLNVAQLDKGIDKPAIRLWEYEQYSPNDSWPLLYASGDRLYVIASRLITLDITQPLTPRVISNVPFGYSFGWARRGNDSLTEILPPVPTLSPRQRLQAVAHPFSFEGDTLCEWLRVNNDSTLLAYRLAQLTDTRAVFKMIGQYTPTLLEEIFGAPNPLDVELQNGLLYVSQYPGNTENPHIDVFDTRGPHPLRLIGHFAAPGVRTVCPLPDGRALVGGDKLWLVGPPPHRGQD
ncbi:MAG: hypothetical protein ABSB42_06075 [Tepidisphaeraceae bacterium]